MKRSYLFLVFILVIGIVFALGDRGGRVNLEEADNAVIPDGGGKAIVSVRGDEVKFKLSVNGLPFLIDTGDLEKPGVKKYHFYEAWLVTDSDEMISMGAFNVDKSGRASIENVFDIGQVRDRQGNLMEIKNIERTMITTETQDGNNMPGETILIGEF